MRLKHQRSVDLPLLLLYIWPADLFEGQEVLSEAQMLWETIGDIKTMLTLNIGPPDSVTSHHTQHSVEC